MPSNERRAAARRRAWGRGPIILKFEQLEGRQLLSASPRADLADLVGEGFTTSVQSADWGDSLSVSGKVLNQGKGAVGKPFDVQIVASSTPILKPGTGVVLGHFTVSSGLGPQQTISYNEQVTLPPTPIPGFAANPIYIASYIAPGHQVAEKNFRNNYSIGMGFDTASFTIVPKQPSQLMGTSFSLSTNGTTWGQQVTVSAQIVNNAQGDAPATQAAVVLTPLNVAPGTGQDVTIGYLSVPAVPAWQTVNVVQTFTLPANAPAIVGAASQFGMYMVQDNNYVTNPMYPHLPTQGLGHDSAQIVIGPGPVSTVTPPSPPDLAAGSIQAPTSPVHWGEGFPITATVQNVGQGVAGPFNVIFVLTNSDGSSASSIFLGETPVGGLAAGASQTINTNLLLPQRLPNGVALNSIGIGRVAMVIDPENVVNETTTANNVSYSNPVSLRLLGADGTSTVPTSAPPVLGSVQAAGTLTPVGGKLTPAQTLMQNRAQAKTQRRLHLKAAPKDKSLTTKIEDKLKVFPKQIGDAISGLFK